tara:strand:- start:185 stop:604 length:420 start_codon:yes stop_codon:yes gene_type:complete
MKEINYFDLSFTRHGKMFDLSFKIIPVKKTLRIKKKKKPQKLPDIKENRLIEECEEIEDIPSFNIVSEEKDMSILKEYEGVSYILFPKMDDVYDEKDLRYVGKWVDEETSVRFTPTGREIHSFRLKQKFETTMLAVVNN